MEILKLTITFGHKITYKETKTVWFTPETIVQFEESSSAYDLTSLKFRRTVCHTLVHTIRLKTFNCALHRSRCMLFFSIL
jgi:hypothetical protein